jgi:8-oxo-dGTP pyrophosphatase MutT (NUDIX family)
MAAKTSKDVVRYRHAEDPQRSCGTCWKFRGPPVVPPTQRPAGYCLKIAGLIYSDDTCDRWEAKRVTKQAGEPKRTEHIVGPDKPQQHPNEPLQDGKVRIFVFNAQGELLGLRRDASRHRAGQWEMVQGSIDPGETAEQAAHREMFEETGYGDADLEDWVQIGARTYTASLTPDASRRNPKIEDNPELEHDEWAFAKPEIMLAWFGRTELMKAAVDDIERILRAISWDDWDALTRMIAPGLSEAAGEGVLQGFGDLDVDDDEAFSLANADAIDYATNRATDLIDLLSQSTRNGLRDLIEQALVDGWSPAQLADAVAGSGLFSPERAQRIAATELALANTAGNLSAWRRSGVVRGKQSLMSNMHDQDDECDRNAEAGVIPLDEAFPSGDDGPPYHPGCQCVVVPVVHADEAVPA